MEKKNARFNDKRYNDIEMNVLGNTNNRFFRVKKKKNKLNEEQEREE